MSEHYRFARLPRRSAVSGTCREQLVKGLEALLLHTSFIQTSTDLPPGTHRHKSLYTDVLQIAQPPDKIVRLLRKHSGLAGLLSAVDLHQNRHGLVECGTTPVQ